MSRLAGELGVPAEARLTEEVSHSTHENAEFSAPILRRLGARRILVVSDRLHMPRAAGAFAAAGFAVERASVPVFASHPDNVSMLYYGLREYVALLYYRERGWLDAAAAPAPTAAATPAASTTMPAAVSPPAWPDGPIVILGASYAAGWQPARLGGHAVVNAGVPGEESWQLLARFDRDVLAHHPRAVILWGFINDIHRAPKDRIDQAVTRAKATFVTMIEKARAAGIEPIVATELTIRPVDTWSETIAGWVGWVMRKESYQAGVNRRVMEVNAWLRDLGRRDGLLVLDLHPRLSDADGVRAKAFVKEDGSHIPSAGYQAIDAYAVPLLDAHLRREERR
jgi:lysophospholipase L1-like esterase